MPPLISDTYRSNLFTMNATSPVDPRQTVPTKPTLLTAEVAELRARLLLSECLETIHAMGVRVKWVPTPPKSSPWFDSQLANLCFSVDVLTQDMNEAIDGACDTIYVATGILVALGVPDVPHLDLVNKANNAKFVNGAVVNAAGKFQKPEGWTPPNHGPLVDAFTGAVLEHQVASSTAWWDDLGGLQDAHNAAAQMVVDKLAELPDIGDPYPATAEAKELLHLQEQVDVEEQLRLLDRVPAAVDEPQAESFAAAAKKRRSKPQIEGK